MCNFCYVYTVIENDCEIEGYKYTGYGICVSETDGTCNFVYPDISRRREDVERRLELCNRLELDPVHIEDVINDFLAFE